MFFFFKKNVIKRLEFYHLLSTKHTVFKKKIVFDSSLIFLDPGNKYKLQTPQSTLSKLKFTLLFLIHFKEGQWLLII